MENERNIEYKTRGVQNIKQKIEKQKMELKIRKYKKNEIKIIN